MVPRAEPQLLLRPSGDQVACMEARGALVLLHRRADGRVVHASRSPRMGAGNDLLARRSWIVAMLRRHRQPRAPDLRPRATRAVPQHAARVQGHVADERRLVGGGGLGVGERPCRRIDARPGRDAAARRGRAAGGGRQRPADGDLHRRSDRQHLGPGLARGAARASLRVRGQRGGRARARRRRSRTPRTAAGPARRLPLLGCRARAGRGDRDGAASRRRWPQPYRDGDCAPATRSSPAR